MDFTIEALKRYLVMQLIDSTQVQNSRDFMTEINDNALNTAKTMKEMNDMFGTKSQPQPPQYQPQSQQQSNYQQPNVFNQPNPLQPNYQHQQPQQPQNYGYPQQQQQQPNYQQLLEMVSSCEKRTLDMQQQITQIQVETFTGLQNIYNTFGKMIETFTQMGGNNPPQQKQN